MNEKEKSPYKRPGTLGLPYVAYDNDGRLIAEAPSKEQLEKDLDMAGWHKDTMYEGVLH